MKTSMNVHETLVDLYLLYWNLSLGRVVVKVPAANQKRPDTPVKKASKPIVEEVAPEARAPTAAQAPSTSTESSMDSGCVSNLDLDNQVADYADFENEVTFVCTCLALLMFVWSCMWILFLFPLIEISRKPIDFLSSMVTMKMENIG